jgi:hypothetical protein
VNILLYPSRTPLTKVETLDQGKRKEFIIYDSGKPNIINGKRNWYRMRWKTDKNKYEVVETGTQKW